MTERFTLKPTDLIRPSSVLRAWHAADVIICDANLNQSRGPKLRRGLALDFATETKNNSHDIELLLTMQITQDNCRSYL